MAELTSTGLIRDISPNDEMVGKNESHYFGVGESALRCISVALAGAGVAGSSVRRILDLPCGHGRVLRYLRAAFPSSEITACDLLRDGVDYCAKTFRAVPVYSEEDPARLRLDQSAFDLIWVGSLLTHLSSARWPRFFDLFRRVLRPGGVLVFSAHGRTAYDKSVRKLLDYGLPEELNAQVLADYERTGFGYGDYAHTNSYGHSLSRPDWVFQETARVPELRIVHFGEKAWDGHHDVYACIRDLAWQVHHPPVPLKERKTERN